MYKVINKELILISPDPDDLFDLNDGQYYVPSPGYGVIDKVRKAMLYKIVDSALQLNSIPTLLKLPSD